MTTTEDLNRLKCEKLVNERWSKASTYYDEIKEILDKGEIQDEREESILMIVAHAALSKMTMDRADDKILFE